MPLERIVPEPGQESVWDYPRPPRLEDSNKHVQVHFNGAVIAETCRAKRVLETSHPPVYYIPLEDCLQDALVPDSRSSYCEWKGQAHYYTVVVDGKEAVQAAWYYSNPYPSFAGIRNYVAFYPGRMDACFLDGEEVVAQEGDFYGGWITSEIVGPFKGAAGTRGW